MINDKKEGTKSAFICTAGGRKRRGMRMKGWGGKDLTKEQEEKE